MELQRKTSDVEEGNNLLLTRLTPVATLTTAFQAVVEARRFGKYLINEIAEAAPFMSATSL